MDTTQKRSPAKNAKKPWTTIREDAFAGVKCLGPLNPETRYRVFKATRTAHKLLVMATVMSKVSFGSACHRIKKQVGTKGLKEIAFKFWLPETRGNKKSFIRMMYDAMQLYRFYNRKGPRLTKDVSIDSAINIFRAIKTMPKRAQNREIRKINTTKQFNGVDINKSKQIRRATAKAKLQAAAIHGPKQKKSNKPKTSEEAIDDLIRLFETTQISLNTKIVCHARSLKVEKYGDASQVKLAELVVNVKALNASLALFGEAFEAILQFNGTEGKKRSWKNCRWHIDVLPWK